MANRGFSSHGADSQVTSHAIWENDRTHVGDFQQAGADYKRLASGWMWMDVDGKTMCTVIHDFNDFKNEFVKAVHQLSVQVSLSGQAQPLFLLGGLIAA